MTLEQAIKALRSGDQAAFTHIYNLYFSKFRNYFYSYLSRYDLAEELTHDIFLKLWSFRQHLPEELDLESYLFLMARNCLYNFLKRKRKEAGVHARVRDREVIALDPSLQQDYQAAYKEYRYCLEQLDPQQKEIFLLSREEGLTYNEIAAQLGISARVVKRKMENALY